MSAPPRAERALALMGLVQGVGFRPFVARVATELGLRGWVRNDSRGVQLRIEGPATVVDAFVGRLRTDLPPAARIARVDVLVTTELPPLSGAGFCILESAEAAAESRPATVTPDLALCPDCRRELTSAADRRFAYPFINCTQCGPRYSIVETPPYDRARTTMAAFTMCPACTAEYGDPTNRRFHAEPNACPRCGPQVALQDGAGRTLVANAAAIAAAADALRTGRILAVKGIGGFHLLCEATNNAVVLELRRRKHRDEKPFAVMFATLAAVRATAELDDTAAEILTSAAAPIVLLPRRPTAGLAVAIAPGNPLVGALLAYTPLHVLLLEAFGGPVVATSGNLSEEPLCTDDAEARARLGGIADLFLGHNRVIARPVDDSVVRPATDGPIVLRRARGMAPVGLPLSAESAAMFEREPALCVGGHLKNTVGITTGGNLVLSPHLGDLENPISRAAFRGAVELLASLHGARFARVVCDAHPDYASTHFAESLGLPVVRVQHHLAHILACLLEHGGGPERVLGVAWDGTGYGEDGTVWGGEFIVVDRRARHARRVAHLRPFRLPGAEAAIREPRRSALALLHGIGATESAFAATAAELGFSARDAAMLGMLLQRGVHAPLTTSAGRLFDGVAALLGCRGRCSFEGQAAMELECAATGHPAETPWPMPLVEADPREPLHLDWEPMIRELVRVRGEVDRTLLAARFHATLAAGIASVASRIGERTVVLTGGCFQNVRLLEATTALLRREGFLVLRHHLLPPNDGALAAGQALACAWGITRVDAVNSTRD